MKRETIRMLSAHVDDDEWINIARHEAGHAVAAILGTIDVYGNTLGIHKVHIRPRGTNFFLSRKGLPIYAYGLCEMTGLYTASVGTAEFVKSTQPKMADHYIKCAEWEIIGCLAGPYADMVSRGHKSLKSIHWNAICSGVGESDFESLFALFDDLKILAGRRAGLEKLKDRTRRLVLDNWLAIDRLATALMEENSMSCADVMSVIGDLLPDRQPQALAA